MSIDTDLVRRIKAEIVVQQNCARKARNDRAREAHDERIALLKDCLRQIAPSSGADLKDGCARTSWSDHQADSERTTPAGDADDRFNPEDLVDLTRLDDLPEDMRAELEEPYRNLDTQVVDLLRTVGQALEVDKIRVGLYRLFGVSIDQAKLSNRLYKLASRGVLIKPPRSRGLYTLPAT